MPEELSLGRFSLFSFELGNHCIQLFAPEAMEPCFRSELFDQMRTDCIIAPNKPSAKCVRFERFISEFSQHPYLGRIIGAVHDRKLQRFPLFHLVKTTP